MQGCGEMERVAKTKRLDEQDSQRHPGSVQTWSSVTFGQKIDGEHIARKLSQQKFTFTNSTVHRYIKQLFLVLGTRLAQFKRYCSVVKCVLDGPLDTHIWPFSRTLGEEILHLYWIYCFWVPFSGRISHHFPTKPSFSPIFRIARLFENFLYQSISIWTWPGAFSGPILLIRTKPDMI